MFDHHLRADTGTAPADDLADVIDGLVDGGLDDVAWSRLEPSGMLLDVVGERVARGVDDWETIEVIGACERVIARAQAVAADATARLVALRGEDNKDGWRQAADEVAAATHTSSWAADRRIDMALALTRRLPGTRAGLYTGQLTFAKAAAVCEATAELDDAAAGRVEERVLARAERQSLAQLRASLRRAVAAVDPDGVRRRHQRQRQARRVQYGPLDDGMASLWAYLTAMEGSAVYTHLTDVAATMKTAGDDRGIDQRRADALVALCLGRNPIPDQHRDIPPTTDADPTDHGHPGGDDTAEVDHADAAEAAQAVNTDGDNGDHNGDHNGDGPAEFDDDDGLHGDGDGGEGEADWLGRWPSGWPAMAADRVAARIRVTVPVGTLLGLDDQPGYLAGYGPIPAELARQLAADGTWRRLLTDPATDTVLDYGRTRYRPPQNLADLVRARDVTCRFPTCNQPAWRCDLDHIIRWPDGPTADYNLAVLCRRHHQLKHLPGWGLHRHADGCCTWTTPTGHTHTAPPDTCAAATPPHDHGPDP